MLRSPGIVALFLSAEGRMARGWFWLVVGLLIAALAMFDAGVHGWARAWLVGPVKLALLVSGACVLAKRLHDRDRAGWWAAAPLFALCVAWPRPHGVLDWVAVVVLAAAMAELGLRPGVRRFNRFGPRPGGG